MRGKRQWDERRPWLALCLVVVALCAVGGCARQGDVPTLADLDWDERALFQTGLVKAERDVLDELPGATCYHIELKVPDGLDRIVAHQEMRYTNREGVSLDEIDLFMMPNYSGGRVVISALTVDDQSLQPAYDYEETLLRILLPQPLPPGEQTSLEIDYVLEIPREMGGKYGLFGYFYDVLVLDTFYPAIAAFDEGEWQVQPPSPNGHPFHLDASYYLVRITAPARLTLVTTGVEVARQVRQGEQVVLLAGGPARDFYIAASERYTKVSKCVGETTVNSYAFRERRDRAQMVLDQTAAALERYNARFGRYPYAEMDIVSTPMRALGVEYPGAMGVSLQLYDPDVDFSGTPSQIYLEATVAHEVAHQWFGNLVGADYADEAWLNEGMAQYATWLYYLDTQGTGAADGFRGSWFGRWDRIDRQEVPLGQSASAFATDAYGAVLYGRAPLFVEALVQEMGESAFDAFIRDYVATHRWQVGSGDTFRSLAEKHCACDLGPLFEDWVYPEE